MCGIAGIVTKTKQRYGFFESALVIEDMLNDMAHRGPDGRGVYEANGVIHGHVRLAIRDTTSAGAQPYVTNAGSVLSYNGELWNDADLREDLGGNFHSACDTETLCRMLEEYGIGALGMIDGQFAFAWTSPDGRTILARDRFGEVPLYVLMSNTEVLAWASERKAFGTFAKDAVALPPGHCLDIASIKPQPWYEMPSSSPESTEPDWFNLLKAGVQRRLVSDVPVCCLISGGLDSTAVLKFALEAGITPIAYTAVLAGEEESLDLLAATRICEELDVELRTVTIAPSKQLFQRALRAIEIPSKAQVEIAALCLPLAEQIAADGFKVCLSGEGADELFCGYGTMRIKAYRMNAEEFRKLKMMYLTKMARHNFIRCNKVFMSAGVECRLPFIHPPLVEAAINTDKDVGSISKHALKDALRGFVPDWIIKRKKETFQGAGGTANWACTRFNTPSVTYNQWCREEFGAITKN